MSANGAKVESSLTLPPGSSVQLIRGMLVAQATVIWSLPGSCGIRFANAVSVKDWLAAPTKAQQQRVDDIIAVVRAGGSAPVELSKNDSDVIASQSSRFLIDDLGAVVRLIQDLEDDLATSSETLARHGLKLQNLDIAMQMIRAIAREMTPSGSRKSISMAELADLRVACVQALGQTNDFSAVPKHVD